MRPVGEDPRAWARPAELVDLSGLPPRVAQEMVEVAAAIDAADRARQEGDRAEAERLLRGAVTSEIDPYRQLAEERLGGLLSEDGRTEEAVALWLRAVEGPDPALRQAVTVLLGYYAFTDAGFLVNADPATALALLPHAGSGFGRVGAAVYEASAHRRLGSGPAVRRRLLALDAVRYGDGELAARIEAVPVPDEEGFPRRRAEWASGAQLGGCRWSVAGHPGAVSALAVAPVAVGGRAVAVSGGNEGTVRLWDLATGEPVGEPMAGHTGPVHAVAAAELDGRAVAVSAGTDGTVRVWDLTTRRPLHPPLTGHTDWVTAVATATVQGRPVAVTGGDDQSVRVWDLATGKPVGKSLRAGAGSGADRGRLATMTTTVLDRRPVALTADFAGAVRVWDLAKGRQLRQPIATGARSVQALAALAVDGRPAVAVGGSAGTTTLWDLATGRRLGERLVARRDWPQTVAAVHTGAGAAVVTADESGMARLWDPAAGRQLAQAFAGPHGGAQSLAATVVDGRPVVLVGTSDGRVHRWDPDVKGRSVGDPLPGHGDDVSAVAVIEVDGTALVLSTARDGSARLWDLATGAAAGTPFDDLREPVEALTTAVVEGRPVVVTVEPLRKEARRWHPADGSRAGAPLLHDSSVGAVATAVLDGRALAVTGDTAGLVRIWDLATGEVLHGPLAGHQEGVTAVATAVVDGRPVAVTADEETVRVWDLASGTPVGEPIALPDAAPSRDAEDADEDDEYDDPYGPEVTAMATAVVDGRPVVAVGREDGLVLVWDLTTRAPVGAPLRVADDSLDAMTVAPVAGRAALVTGDRDGTVRTWDLAALTPIGPDLVLPLPVGALAAAPQGRLVVGFGWEIAVFRLVEAADASAGAPADA
ncbi:WD40 repeat domain-containing protein [Kitasatospora sp. NPDC058190]|uniref:WD40 repeat domain-containing protein n=1 Tax=Kitasatospora sp. NPDC058190 TaxID=3346371 RepID=UPI0036DB2417